LLDKIGDGKVGGRAIVGGTIMDGNETQYLIQVLELLLSTHSHHERK
jgi:hypothetical protein